jgi:hypothetical protein
MLFATASFQPFNFLWGSRFIINKNTNFARAVAIFCKYPLVVFMFIALNIDILIKEIIVICSKRINFKFYQIFCLIVFPPLCKHLLHFIILSRFSLRRRRNRNNRNIFLYFFFNFLFYFFFNFFLKLNFFFILWNRFIKFIVRNWFI